MRCISLTVAALTCLLVSSITGQDYDKTGMPLVGPGYPFAQHYVNEQGVTVRLYGVRDRDTTKLKIWGEFLVGAKRSAKQKVVDVRLAVDSPVVKIFDSATSIPLKLCRMCSGMLAADWYDSEDQFDIDTFRIPIGARALQIQYTFTLESSTGEISYQETQFLDTLMRTGNVSVMTWWKGYREPDLPQWSTYEINYFVPESSHVRIVVYWMWGAPIDTLLDIDQGPGFHGTSWLPPDTLSDFMYQAVVQIGDQGDTRWCHFWRIR